MHQNNYGFCLVRRVTPIRSNESEYKRAAPIKRSSHVLRSTHLFRNAVCNKRLN
jgi:hypothetical protein